MSDRQLLAGIRAVLLDLDGVMYRGAKLCNGAAEFVHYVRQRGIRTFFLSNNSRSGPDVVARKLTSLDVPTPDEQVITAAELAVEYLSRQRRKGSVAVLGSEWLSEQLEGAGWRPGGNDADCVLVGLDHQFTYAKLQTGVDALLGGAAFVAANRDPVNPIEHTLEPGCGALVSALETATGRRARCMGKPTLTMLRQALARMQLRPDQALMVGDSLVSDMALARRGGTHSALLLSGQTSAGMAQAQPPSHRPDLVLEDLAALHHLWRSDTN